MSVGHIIETGFDTVWVHETVTGSTVGRFGRFGIDIHYRLDPDTLGYVDRHGNPKATHCADCRHDLQGQEAWHHFKAGMADIHGVIVTDENMPDWLKDEGKK